MQHFSYLGIKAMMKSFIFSYSTLLQHECLYLCLHLCLCLCLSVCVYACLNSIRLICIVLSFFE